VSFAGGLRLICGANWCLLARPNSSYLISESQFKWKLSDMHLNQSILSTFIYSNRSKTMREMLHISNNKSLHLLLEWVERGLQFNWIGVVQVGQQFLMKENLICSDCKVCHFWICLWGIAHVTLDHIDMTTTGSHLREIIVHFDQLFYYYYSQKSSQCQLATGHRHRYRQTDILVSKQSQFIHHCISIFTAQHWSLSNKCSY